MAVWKKVLTRDSAVSTSDGLYLGTAENVQDVSVDINLNDGANTDSLTLTTTSGLKANVVSSNILLQADFPALQDGVLGTSIGAGTQTGITVSYDNNDNEVDFVVNNSSLVASSGTNAVVLTLTGPAGDTDAITINEGSNITINNIGDGAFTINAATLTEEQVEDYVWTMLDGTHNGLSIVYADEDAGGLGELTFTVDDQTLVTSQSGSNIEITLSNPTDNASIAVFAGANVTLTNDVDNDAFEIAVTDSAIQAALENETLIAAQSTNDVTVTLSGSAGESDSVTFVAGDGITLTESNGDQIEIAAVAPSTINVTDGDDAGTVFPMFASVANGEATVYTDATTFTYDRSTDTLTVGNLTVTGNTTTVNTTDLVVTDKNIVIADGAGSAGNASGAGLTVDSGGQFLWETGATLTGWKVTDTDAVTHEVSTMDFGNAVPLSSNNAAGLGSFHFDSTAGKLYIRTA
jgi:hypothetical protein